MKARDSRTCPELDSAWLAKHPLPPVDPDGDKEARGHVLVIAGGRDMPGAAMLASIAALRAGAGKMTVMTSTQTAAGVGVALPEARVLGGFSEASLMALAADGADLGAILLGPGMGQRDCSRMARLAPDLFAGSPIVLDAAAMGAALEPKRAHERILLTPHAGELAGLTGWAKERIVAEPAAAAVEAAAQWSTHVLLKGSTTVLATPIGLAWKYESQCPGLATSGSGDVLAGSITGLLARGASMTSACAWAAAAHDRCGKRLNKRIGELGYLAREIVDEIPCAIADLARLARRYTRTSI